MGVNFISVTIDKPDSVNLILGQAHFIKTVEDLHEALVTAVPGIAFGLAFCESSGPCLVRWSGTDQALVELARATPRPLTGELRLGVIPTVGPYLLPRALPEVRRRFPELRLILREDQTERVLAQLRAGQLDLILAALPLEGTDLELEPLFDDHFLVAAPAAHPAAHDRFE